MIKLGTTDISTVKLGTTPVSKIYLGATEVWSSFNLLSLNPTHWYSDTGSDVSIWPDISGNARHAVATGGTPTIVANGVGSRQVRRCAGQWYVCPSPFPTTPVPITVIAVSQRSVGQINALPWQRLVSAGYVSGSNRDHSTGVIIYPAMSSGAPIAYGPDIRVFSSTAYANQFQIGKSVDASSERLWADVIEVIVFNSILTTDVLNNALGVFKSKYNIP